MSPRDLLSRTGVALVTPFKKDSSVDFDALFKLINSVIEGGVQYVVTLGTTGETPTLSKEEKKDIVDFTFSTVSNRVPVVIGIGGNNTSEIISEINRLPIAKAAAILSASPYYNKPSQEGIFLHYKTIAQETPKPIIIYNVPGRTGSNITAETTLRLAKEIENICGIKEASGNMIQCMHILKHKPEDFFVTSGDDHLAMSQIAMGMDGVISVAANAFPKDFSSMINCIAEGKVASARALYFKLLKAFDLMFAENNPAGVKAFLSEMGIIENNLRLPLVPLSEQYHNAVKRYITKWD